MERIYSIDFLKFFAIFAVVVIHTFPLDGFMGYFIIDNIARFAVPFFFVASGYFFAQKISNSSNPVPYFKKYVFKLIKIYVCWLIFYITFDVLTIYMRGTDVVQNLIKYFEDLSLVNLLYYGKGTSGYQLWFLSALIWSSTILFIFFRLKKIQALFIMSLILNLIGLFGQAYTFFQFPINNTRDALFFGLFYTTLGFLFVTNTLLNNLNRGTMYLSLTIIFSFLQVMEGYILDKKLSGSHGEYFLFTIFLTAFLFLFALTNKQMGKGLFITKVGGNALGIYIIHVFFLEIFKKVMNKLELDYLSENFIWNLCYTLLIFIMSYYTYHFLQTKKEKMKEIIE